MIILNGRCDHHRGGREGRGGRESRAAHVRRGGARGAHYGLLPAAVGLPFFSAETAFGLISLNRGSTLNTENYNNLIATGFGQQCCRMAMTHKLGAR